MEHGTYPKYSPVFIHVIQVEAWTLQKGPEQCNVGHNSHILHVYICLLNWGQRYFITPLNEPKLLKSQQWIQSDVVVVVVIVREF